MKKWSAAHLDNGNQAVFTPLTLFYRINVFLFPVPSCFFCIVASVFLFYCNCVVEVFIVFCLSSSKLLLLYPLWAASSTLDLDGGQLSEVFWLLAFCDSFLLQVLVLLPLSPIKSSFQVPGWYGGSIWAHVGESQWLFAFALYFWLICKTKSS